MAVRNWAVDGVHVGVLTRDTASGELVLVTNGKCIFDHSDAASFRGAHAGNGGQCCFQPFEGLVFQTKDNIVQTWSMRQILDRELKKVEDEAFAVSVLEQMNAILEADRGARRKARRACR